MYNILCLGKNTCYFFRSIKKMYIQNVSHWFKKQNSIETIIIQASYKTANKMTSVTKPFCDNDF